MRDKLIENELFILICLILSIYIHLLGKSFKDSHLTLNGRVQV